MAGKPPDYAKRCAEPQPGGGRATSDADRLSRLHPVEALDAWMAADKITSLAVFVKGRSKRSSRRRRCRADASARIVERTIKATGLDEKNFCGPSIRAGFITSALEGGQNPQDQGPQPPRQTGYARAYNRRENDFDEHSGGELL